MVHSMLFGFSRTLFSKGTALENITLIVTCNAATGQKGSTKNRNATNKKRHRGWKVQDGDFVHKGYVLSRQIHKFRWLPGANVICGRRKTFNAACSGTVRFTKEIFIPEEDQPLAKTAATFPRGAMLYKTFINVVPPKEVGRFRLIETV